LCRRLAQDTFRDDHDHDDGHYDQWGVGEGGSAAVEEEPTRGHAEGGGNVVGVVVRLVRFGLVRVEDVVTYFGLPGLNRLQGPAWDRHVRVLASLFGTSSASLLLGLVDVAGANSCRSPLLFLPFFLLFLMFLLLLLLTLSLNLTLTLNPNPNPKP
jgi:hypothetical protein